MARVPSSSLIKLLKACEEPQLRALEPQAWRLLSGSAAADAATPSRPMEVAPHAEDSMHQPSRLLAAAGGLALLGAAYQAAGPSVAHTEAAAQIEPAPTQTQGDDLAKYHRPDSKQGRPKDIILYQYEVCPFCNKVRAFLDYHKVPYRIVEVNPLTKKQLKWTTHKKVPVVLIDNELLDDSSLILSRLAVEYEEQQTEPPRGWFSKSTKASPSKEAIAEETEWRRWVDKRFVQVITVNIYRNLAESWQTFNYIAEHANFNFAERQAARVAGSGLMWGISGKLIKKYGIQGDLRANLFSDAEKWMEALGSERPFMGGPKPNLADLSMFGVIRSVTGTDTFMDLMHKTSISSWYERMMSEVGPSSRLDS